MTAKCYAKTFHIEFHQNLNNSSWQTVNSNLSGIQVSEWARWMQGQKGNLAQPWNLFCASTVVWKVWGEKITYTVKKFWQKLICTWRCLCTAQDMLLRNIYKNICCIWYCNTYVQNSYPYLNQAPDGKIYKITAI
jgi:hypothetical protein